MSLTRRRVLLASAGLLTSLGGCASSTFTTTRQPVTNPTTADQSDIPPALRTNGVSIDWQIPLGKRIAQPAVADGTVFATSSTGGLSALDAEDGTQQWHQQRPRSGWFGPTVTDGRVFSVDYQTLVVYDAETGAEQWRKEWPKEATIQAKPTVGTDTVYLANSSRPLSHSESKFIEDLFAFDVADGTLRWKRHLGEDDHEPIAGQPLFHNNTLYVHTERTGLFALNPEDGTTKWVFEPDTGNTRMERGPNIAGETLVTSTPELAYGLDPVTGTKQWETGLIYGTPVTDESTVYAQGDGGPLYALRASDGVEKWRLSRPGELRTPSTAGGHLFANFVRRTGEKDTKDSISTLYRIDDAGDVQWRFTRICEGFSGAARAGNRVFVAGRYGDGRLYALQPES